MKDHQFVERGSHDELRAAGGLHSGHHEIQHDLGTSERASQGATTV